MASRTTPTETRTISRADAEQHRRALRRVECAEHYRAEQECSSEAYDRWLTRRAEKLGIDTDELSARMDAAAIDKVARILGYRPAGVFINGDPRGYALKIQPEHAADLPKDFGGYGIIAPVETPARPAPTIPDETAAAILEDVREIAENEWSNGACDDSPSFMHSGQGKSHFAIHIEEQCAAAEEAYNRIRARLGIPTSKRQPYTHSRHS